MWSVKCGAQSVKCTVLSVKCEAWSVECKVWSVQCEVWSVRCRVGSVKCRVPVVLHCQLPNCLLRLAGGSRLAHLGSKDAAAAPKHTMAVKDGSGPQPAAQSAKRRFLNA